MDIGDSPRSIPISDLDLSSFTRREAATLVHRVRWFLGLLMDNIREGAPESDRITVAVVELARQVCETVEPAEEGGERGLAVTVSPGMFVRAYQRAGICNGCAGDLPAVTSLVASESWGACPDCRRPCSDDVSVCTLHRGHPGDCAARSDSTRTFISARMGRGNRSVYGALL